MHTLERKDFDLLLTALRQQGYITLGPVVRADGDHAAITYDEVQSSADFPAGWQEQQEAGFYRIRQTGSAHLFQYTIAAQSWKQFLYPPLTRLFSVTRQGKSLSVQATESPISSAGIGTSPETPVRHALIGVRACELNAIARLDAVFNVGQYADPLYKSRREGAFIVAVQCGRAGATCFCESMKTGPAVQAGYDLLLTEVLEKDRHYFIMASGSSKGAAVLASIPHGKASTEEAEHVKKAVRNAKAEMGRTVNTDSLAKQLANSIDSPIWSDIAKRCMTCANCTMVCPTCFCSTVDDVMDLAQTTAERRRRWDSCFTMDFSKVTGGNFRSSHGARYRQWLTHKFSYWQDQFGTFGCVGCGRCIVWCPAKIDVTKELERIEVEQHPNGRGAASLFPEADYQSA